MLIQLPNETWIEILNWLKRRDLLGKMDTLWDRQFTPIVQDWLHKYTRNVQIGHLWADGDVLKIRDDHGWEQVPIAEVDKPENITSFFQISISGQLGPATLAFLHRMRPLYRNVCLDLNGLKIDEELPTQHQANIRHMMQLVSHDQQQIESIILDRQCLQFLVDNFPPSIRFNARLLCYWNYSTGESELLVDWLFTPRQDGQPRTLVFYEYHSFDDFCEKVRERFLNTTRQQLASPFFVRWPHFGGETPSVTENARTGELLTVRNADNDDFFSYGLITNCPIGTDGSELLTRKTTELLDWKHYNQQQRFFVYYGAIDVENEQQQLADDNDN